MTIRRTPDCRTFCQRCFDPDTAGYFQEAQKRLLFCCSAVAVTGAAAGASAPAGASASASAAAAAPAAAGAAAIRAAGRAVGSTGDASARLIAGAGGIGIRRTGDRAGRFTAAIAAGIGHIAGEGDRTAEITSHRKNLQKNVVERSPRHFMTGFSYLCSVLRIRSTSSEKRSLIAP